MTERRKRNPITRFTEKLAIDETGCHIWQAQRQWQGYGAFWFRGAKTPAHRVAWILFKGEIPKETCVLHRCDVMACVNPDHLFLGSRQDNVADMDAKVRRKTRAKLHHGQQIVGRALLAAGLSQQWIADAFSVHQGTISRFKLNKAQAYKI